MIVVMLLSCGNLLVVNYFGIIGNSLNAFNVYKHVCAVVNWLNLFD